MVALSQAAASLHCWTEGACAAPDLASCALPYMSLALEPVASSSGGSWWTWAVPKLLGSTLRACRLTCTTTVRNLGLDGGDLSGEAGLVGMLYRGPTPKPMPMPMRSQDLTPIRWAKADLGIQPLLVSLYASCHALLGWLYRKGLPLCSHGPRHSRPVLSVGTCVLGSRAYPLGMLTGRGPGHALSCEGK